MATSVDMKLLKQTKFPPEFTKKVDMKKVNLEVMKRWISSKIAAILGTEDDIVTELCINLLESSQFPDIKKLQISLTGFLDKDTGKFCKELWNLCLSAQSNPQGVPKELLEAKKLELIQEKMDAEKAAEEANRRRNAESRREIDIASIRQREREGRRGRGDSRRGGRGGREFDRQSRRDSRSPRRRRSPGIRESRGLPTRREVDTYIPAGMTRARDSRGAPGARERSRSRSPSVVRRRSRSITPLPRRHRVDSPIRPREYEADQRWHRSPSRDRRSRHTKRRDSYEERGARGVDRGDHNRRSSSSSDASRSRSTRTRPRRSAYSPSSPHSRIKSSKSKSSRRRRYSPSSSRSRSRSMDRHHRRSDKAYRMRMSPSYNTTDEVHVSRADVDKEQKRHRRHHYSRDYGRRPSPNRSRSRDASPRRSGKRRRSLERYEPLGKRRRNTSSASSENETRQTKADGSGDERHRDRKTSHRLDGQGDRGVIKSESTKAEETQLKSSTKSETELREALLKEKVRSMRRPSIVDNKGS